MYHSALHGLEKSANKINEDIKIAKQYQAETEEIQTNINNLLKKARLETTDLIKSANQNLQAHTAKELEKLDNSLNAKLDESSSIIEKNKADSLNQINDQIFDITKLTLSKISSVVVSNSDIKDIVTSEQQKLIN